VSWLAPTIRLVRWWSLLAPVAAALALSAAVRASGTSIPTTMALLIAAAVATAAPASLDDPAHELLRAMPMTRRQRVLHRLTVVVPAVAAAWALAAVAMLGTEGDWLLPPLGALVALGIAVTCIASRIRPDVSSSIGVGAPLVAVAVVALPSTGWLRSIGHVWIEHPWPTITAALVVAIVATTDPIEPSRATAERTKCRHNRLTRRRF
jgi:hypothetical protein